MLEMIPFIRYDNILSFLLARLGLQHNNGRLNILLAESITLKLLTLTLLLFVSHSTSRCTLNQFADNL